MSALVPTSREVLRVHARSFSWASFFLPPDRRDAAAVLYAFCRHVDDLADENPPDVGRVELVRVRAELVGQEPPRPLVEAVRALLGDELEAAVELVDGVTGDLEPVRVEDDAELIRYAYAVAGTVGRMMCPVLGVTDGAARAHAVDLGIAMQITNICRDVAEDAARGRTYLPARRLRAHGVSPGDLLADRADRRAVAAVVSELLDVAERYYASAERGMCFLPGRSRLAILVASRVYRAIGVRLRARGCDALAGRTVVPAGDKLIETVWALGRWLAGTPRGPHDAALHAPLRRG